VQERYIAALQEWLDEPASARKSHRRGGLSPAALRRVELFVAANIGRSVHIADLAARAGLSVHHFARAFRTSTGTTPHAFVERRRIEHAKALIDDTDQSLAGIAAATGFATQSHLTPHFARLLVSRQRPIDGAGRRNKSREPQPPTAGGQLLLKYTAAEQGAVRRYLEDGHRLQRAHAKRIRALGVRSQSSE
jgi:AraC-like DNA-binding protein